jgi:HAD superfamily hydrolase (TIGR01509 family)
MQGLDAILFDFDGVLIDSEAVHYRCWRELLAPHRITLDWNRYASAYVGTTDSYLLKHIYEIEKPSCDWEVFFSMSAQKKERFRQLMKKEPPFFDGIHEFLRSLSPYGLAVVSSSSRTEVEPLLLTARLSTFFKAMVFGEDVNHAKPAPEPYLRAARLLDARMPLVVEDSEIGETSGRAAGFEVLRVGGPSEVVAAIRERILLGTSAPRQN